MKTVPIIAQYSEDLNRDMLFPFAVASSQMRAVL